MATTANMGLTKPDVNVTAGPTWATNLNTNADTIDNHDHSSAKGIQVTPAGINISTELNFNNKDAIGIRTIRLNSTNPTLDSETDLMALYQKSGDLYYVNDQGEEVRLTDDNAISATSIGGIGSMGETNASVTWDDTNKIFTFLQNTNETALLATESIYIYTDGVSTQSVKLQYTGTNPKTLTLPETTATLAHIGSDPQTFAGNIILSGNLTVNGTTTTVDTTELTVKDKNITINDGGGADSGALSGIDIEEGGSITGYMRVASDRTNFEIKAPGGSILTIDANVNKTLTVAGDLGVEANSLINQDVTDDASPTFTGVTLGNTGLRVKESSGTDALIIKPASALTADRTLSITTGNANTAISIEGTSSVIDQDLSANSTTAAFDVLTLPNTGLRVKETSGDKYLTIKPGADLTDNRTLTITTDTGTNTAISIEGSGSVIDQDLSVASTTAEFGKITLGNTGLQIKDSGSNNVLIIKPVNDLNADYTLSLITGNANRSLTLSGNLDVESASVINQDVTTNADVTFNKVTLTSGVITQPHRDEGFVMKYNGSYNDHQVELWADYLTLHSLDGHAVVVEIPNSSRLVLKCNATYAGEINSMDDADVGTGWVFIWVISNLTVTRVVGSTATTATALNDNLDEKFYRPAGTLFFRLVGAVYRDSSVNRKFYQKGNVVIHPLVFTDIAGAAASASYTPTATGVDGTLVTLNILPDLPWRLAKLRGYFQLNGGYSKKIYLTTNNVYAFDEYFRIHETAVTANVGNFGGTFEVPLWDNRLWYKTYHTGGAPIVYIACSGFNWNIF